MEHHQRRHEGRRDRILTIAPDKTPGGGGSKMEDAGTYEIKDGKLTLSLKAGEALELVTIK